VARKKRNKKSVSPDEMTLEELENDFWGEPKFSSSLVKSCHALRKKKLNEFSPNDLRIMIGQNIGLEYLIPLAITALAEEIMLEATFFEGDLLSNLLRSSKEYWQENANNKKLVDELLLDNKFLIENFNSPPNVKQELLSLIEKFQYIDE